MHPDDIHSVMARHTFLRDRLEKYAALRQEVEGMMKGGADEEEITLRLDEIKKTTTMMHQGIETPIKTRHGGRSPPHGEGGKAEDNLDDRVEHIEELLTVQSAKIEKIDRCVSELVMRLQERWDEKDQKRTKAQKVNPLNKGFMR